MEIGRGFWKHLMQSLTIATNHPREEKQTSQSTTQTSQKEAHFFSSVHSTRLCFKERVVIAIQCQHFDWQEIILGYSGRTATTLEGTSISWKLLRSSTTAGLIFKKRSFLLIEKRDEYNPCWTSLFEFICVGTLLYWSPYAITRYLWTLFFPFDLSIFLSSWQKKTKCVYSGE